MKHCSALLTLLEPPGFGDFRKKKTAVSSCLTNALAPLPVALLGGSILLKFLLETRLQSESFDTLDDLLGFRVQKL